MTTEATRHDAPHERAAMLPADYSAGAHLIRTVLIASGIAAGALWLARTAAPIDWLLLPAFFVVANFIEWAVHKNPMHRPLTPRILYTNHALIHHRAFLQDTMAINNTRELGLIMMPWYTMLGLFVVASPVAFAAAWWRGWGAAGIFFFAAAMYFVTYEGLHALYHLPDPTLRKIGLGGRWFDKMRGHHRHHHRLDRMPFVNFNVTFPLVDWVMGTKEREGSVPMPARATAPAASDASSAKQASA